MGTFSRALEQINFPKEEEKVLQFWKDTDAFRQSLKLTEGRPPYIFYDGPPFATGLPHYGHILTGTLKDIVTRYYSQAGYHVERRFGWDCHGLPVEYEIDKVHQFKGKADVQAFGIDNYNEECRGIVTRFTSEWRQIVERFGRWVDFDNDYKTMDLNYMESVWWVFKQLFEKGVVYRAFRVMPYSTALQTPLSNFEVSQNYRDVPDPSIIVGFRAKEAGVRLVAWTTTPWTLPSNLALCVHPALTYLRTKNLKTGEVWVVGEARFEWVCAQMKLNSKEDFQLEKKMLGKELEGTEYTPLLPYFSEKLADKMFTVVTAEYVTTDAGTCIVHQAPAFGEDDYQVCVANGIITKDGKRMVCPVDEDGKFTKDVPDFEGLGVKEADQKICAKLKADGVLFNHASEVHQYPHCWRSDTPLIYRALPSWFIEVENIRDRLVKNNNETYWVPAHVKEKRFHNWLMGARDWCVSRNRNWGTPLPLWVSDDFEEVVCVGSVAELEELTGQKGVTDIHRHFIDHLTIPSKKGKGLLRRVDEVFDCWFESGSMPYAQLHYPFENQEVFKQGFPAQFIAEGLDQTRGWFYTLMVLSTHLFDKAPFKNLVVNGLVLASDGKKMSKRLQNYPDPMNVVNAHGADACRLYLINSPVVRAEPLKFQEQGVKDVVKDVFLPWFNSFKFLVQECFRFEQSTTPPTLFKAELEAVRSSTNVMDKWIYASCQSLIGFVRREMEAYRLYTVVPKLLLFLDQLTNWYVRLNRDRMRGNAGPAEARAALNTLYTVLLDVCILLAPMTPFLTETLYQELRKALPEGNPRLADCVHFVPIPEVDEQALDDMLIKRVERMQSIVELARQVREKRKVGLKMPLQEMVVYSSDASFVDDVEQLRKYVLEEVNVLSLRFERNPDSVQLIAAPNFRALGARDALKTRVKDIQAALKALDQPALLALVAEGVWTFEGHSLEVGVDIVMTRQPAATEDANREALSDSQTLVELDFTANEHLSSMAMAREMVNRVQRFRKELGLQQDDPVVVYVGKSDTAPEEAKEDKVEDKKGGKAKAKAKGGKKEAGPAAVEVHVEDVLASQKDYMVQLLRRSFEPLNTLPSGEVVGTEISDLGAGQWLKIVIRNA